MEGRVGAPGHLRSSHLCPLPLTPPGRSHQQWAAEGGRAADPAGPVQRGLSLSGDTPHAVCRLPQGQEGRLPGDSRGAGREGAGDAHVSPGLAFCSRYLAEAPGAPSKVGLAVPTLQVMQLRLKEVERLAPGDRPPVRRDPLWAGLRLQPNSAPCSLPTARRFAQGDTVERTRRSKPTEEGRGGWSMGTHP